MMKVGTSATSWATSVFTRSAAFASSMSAYLSSSLRSSRPWRNCDGFFAMASGMPAECGSCVAPISAACAGKIPGPYARTNAGFPILRASSTPALYHSNGIAPS